MNKSTPENFTKFIVPLFLVLFLFVSNRLFSQSDREVKGYVTSLGNPLNNAQVAVKGTDNVIATDSKGFYTINVKPRQVLQFSYIGFETVEIIVEDVTSMLNVKLLPEVNDLEEVTVTGKSKVQKDFEEENGPNGRPRKMPTAMGYISTGGSSTYVKGESLNQAAVDLARAIDGRAAGMEVNNEGEIFIRAGNSINNDVPAIWDIDGMIYTEPPFIDIANVQDVLILKSLSQTSRYGNIASGGVIVVRTKGAYFAQRKQEVAATYGNKKVYSGDALDISKVITPIPNYLKDLEEINDSEKANTLYREYLKANSNDPEFYADVANYFFDLGESTSAITVLSDMETKFETNAEVLKILAYTLEEHKKKEEALSVYKKIFRLRPKYAQSYRDIGNAFSEVENYQKAWLMYMGYMNTQDGLTGSGVDAVIYREMEALYLKHKNQIDVDAKFALPDDKSELTYDVRLVFEWNTSEAEFEIEFVNPQNQPFSFNHTLEQNAERIKNEKLKGYTSEEFLIDDLGAGDWLVNIKYFGNKQFQPTFLKVTSYYNWQQPNQKHTVEVFKLTRQNIKMQLLKLNSSALKF
ncbi:carboxypeptidase-like protein [Leeuwenhoekiella aestuarii]|uniref:Carboxypeptidase-like protein n=1 Tax=Leeuwenhoekiella aestuarii TaxID=2249426 RepID=A0A4Q0NWQ6_9FLAO|nr:carboxypeptidase-like regulatory domain-containing protein [Leeuwenhoekiella aestuarii]RXG15669.1 carboxypeptidase-like protein [Leeuwenhoekiella aestuarii]RXG17222.1 carboxypeptidase-like protein [Leeuwenhoekiella aestuarii]